MFGFFISAAHALGQPGGAGASSQTSGWAAFMPIIIIVGVFYVLVFLPQKKEQKRRKVMLKEVKKNDKIITSSGIYGVITGVEEDHIIVKISETSKVKMVKSAVATVIKPEDIAKKAKPSK